MAKRKRSIFMNLKMAPQLAPRLASASDEPKWFAFPFLALGFDVVLQLKPSVSLVKALLRGNDVTLLAFNPSRWYLLLFALPLNVRRVALFQWRPLGRLSLLKRLAAMLLLSRAHEIAVYDAISLRYIRRLYPRKTVKHIGLYTDTDFFCPAPSSIKGNFILVPGDHKRNDAWLKQFAELSGKQIVRVTRDNGVFKTCQPIAQIGSNIDLRFNVSFKELRELYRTAECVVIVSDSSEIPTGITTFCEALSCGARVVITKGHSNAGYETFMTPPPYVSIKRETSPIKMAHALIESVTLLSSRDVATRARTLMLDRCSLEKMKMAWSDILHER